MDEIEYLGATSTIQSYNLFTYCEGNPVNMVDESGTVPIGNSMFFVEETAVVSTVIATAVAVISTVAATVVASVAAAYVGISTVKMAKKTISIYNQIINKVKENKQSKPNKSKGNSGKSSFISGGGFPNINGTSFIKDVGLTRMNSNGYGINVFGYRVVNQGVTTDYIGLIPGTSYSGYGGVSAIMYDKILWEDIGECKKPW